MTTVAVIPARYASTRFPGKALAHQTGKYLIQHVYERVGSCRRVDRVLVATDDERIAEAVKSFGGEARMTRADHANGTERVAEAIERLGLAPCDVVLNVQGDEPEIDAETLDRLIERMDLAGPARPAGPSACDARVGGWRSSAAAGRYGIGTLAAPFDDDGPREGPGSPLDPNCVKVVVDAAGRALYFSRSLIPHPRETRGGVDRPSRWLLHLGVYAFRVDVLERLVGGGCAPGRLELGEGLEQLRWLEQGFAVGVLIVDHRFVGIDTPEDYAAFVKRTVRSSGLPAGGHGPTGFGATQT